MFCARCGQQIAEGTQACPYCGQPPVIASQSVPAPAPALYPVPPSYYAPPALNGVQGWLLLFCIVLTIVWPLWILANYGLTYVATFRLRRHFVISPIVVAGWLRVAFGIVTGIVVWTKMRPAIAFLRIYYLVGVAMTVWTLNSWIHFIARALRQPVFYVGLMFNLVPSLVFLISGLLYFSLSKRVRNTFGSNLFG